MEGEECRTRQPGRRTTYRGGCVCVCVCVCIHVCVHVCVHVSVYCVCTSMSAGVYSVITVMYNLDCTAYGGGGGGVCEL